MMSKIDKAVFLYVFRIPLLAFKTVVDRPGPTFTCHVCAKGPWKKAPVGGQTY